MTAEPWTTRMVLWTRWGGVWHIAWRVECADQFPRSSLVCGRTVGWWDLVVATFTGIDSKPDPATGGRARMCRLCLERLERAGLAGDLAEAKKGGESC